MISVSSHTLQGTTANGAAVAQETSPNLNGTIEPKFIVFHYTACPFAVAKAAFLRTTGNRVSAHLLVDTDGSVTQFVPLNKRAWHAGESTWAGFSDLNTHSIGIEVVNFGYLQRTAAGGFVSWDGTKTLTPSEVVEAKHKYPEHPYSYWHAYTAEQIATCSELVQVLSSSYATRDVVGHDDISRPRKQDPGPAFPLMGLRSLGVSRATDTASESMLCVTASKLNIREGPSAASKVLGTLTNGTLLRSLSGDSGGWINVEALLTPSLTGWVSAQYTCPKV